MCGYYTAAGVCTSCLLKNKPVVKTVIIFNATDNCDKFYKHVFDIAEKLIIKSKCI